MLAPRPSWPASSRVGLSGVTEGTIRADAAAHRGIPSPVTAGGHAHWDMTDLREQLKTLRLSEDDG
jgi:hypothetical protein